MGGSDTGLPSRYFARASLISSTRSNLFDAPSFAAGGWTAGGSDLRLVVTLVPFVLVAGNALLPRIGRGRPSRA
jgi:hypothetical protein